MHPCIHAAVKYASAKYLDELPTSGDDTGRAFRDLQLVRE
jgi:fumarate hydratase class I